VETNEKRGALRANISLSHLKYEEVGGRLQIENGHAIELSANWQWMF
jgi:hypothetical protein